VIGQAKRFPIQLWSNDTTQQLPYPTTVLGKNRSDSVTASLTNVFSPTMTNEFVFGYTFIGFPNVFEATTGAWIRSAGLRSPANLQCGVLDRARQLRQKQNRRRHHNGWQVSGITQLQSEPTYRESR
jgi:hypothetical protein